MLSCRENAEKLKYCPSHPVLQCGPLCRKKCPSSIHHEQIDFFVLSYRLGLGASENIRCQIFIWPLQLFLAPGGYPLGQNVIFLFSPHKQYRITFGTVLTFLSHMPGDRVQEKIWLWCILHVFRHLSGLIWAFFAIFHEFWLSSNLFKGYNFFLCVFEYMFGDLKTARGLQEHFKPSRNVLR